MDRSTPGFPVHQLPELVQTHVRRVGDAIQPSHPLSPPSPAFSLSQHQGLFQGVSSLHAKLLYVCVLSYFSRVQLLATPWTAACQVPLSVGFSRQEYWGGLPCPPQGIFPTQESNRLLLTSPPLAAGFFTTRATWEAPISLRYPLLFFFLLISALISIHAFFQMLVHSGTSLVLQRLRLLPPNAGGTGSIPGQAAKIPQATWQINNNDSSYEN